MKKILWIGEYLNPTGFARVCKSIIAHLPQKKYDITFLDYQKCFAPTPAMGITLMGTLDAQDLNGFDTLRAMKLDKYDIIMLVNDPWGIDYFLQILEEKKWTKPVVAYFPVDAENHDADWYARFNMVSTPVTYTNFGYNVATLARPDLKTKLKIIPHGIDTDVFYKIDAPLEEIRTKAYGTDKFNQGFIFLNANRNQPRKRLDITVRAFAEFAKGKDDVWLHMHCGNTDKSMNIHKLSLRYGCAKRTIFTTGVNSHGWQRVSEQQLNYFYNAAQVGLNSSIGEGWGLCNAEHAATGAIQIVPAHSACKELFKNLVPEWFYSFLVPSPTPYTVDDIMTVGYLPDIDKMAQKMEAVYLAYKNNPDWLASYAENTMKRFTSEEFLWKNIGIQWDSIFSSL